jgi:hypothetical protein
MARHLLFRKLCRQFFAEDFLKGRKIGFHMTGVGCFLSRGAALSSISEAAVLAPIHCNSSGANISSPMVICKTDH